MSTHNTPHPADEGDDGDNTLMGTQGQTKVRDLEQISERHRLKELLNRRRELLDTRDRVVEALEYGQIGYQRAVSVYAEKLTGLVLDVYPMFSWAERGEWYFLEVEIDQIPVAPPRGLRKSVAETAGRPEGKTVPVRGLSWFIDNGVTVSREFTGYAAGGVQQTTTVQQEILPMQTVDSGVQTITQFLHEVDVDVQFDDSSDEAAAGYEVIEKYQDEMNIDPEEIRG